MFKILYLCLLIALNLNCLKVCTADLVAEQNRTNGANILEDLLFLTIRNNRHANASVNVTENISNGVPSNGTDFEQTADETELILDIDIQPRAYVHGYPVYYGHGGPHIDIIVPVYSGYGGYGGHGGYGGGYGGHGGYGGGHGGYGGGHHGR